MKKFLLDKRGIEKLPVHKSKLLWGGVILKLLIAAFFASDVLVNKFAPFGNYFIESGFSNPYAYFQHHDMGADFPYPPLMLFIMSLPRMIFWPLVNGSVDSFTMWDSILYRIPLLFADFVILAVLIRWLKTKIRKVLIWYWLSPVLIYINYFHGQLDVIPIAILFASLHLLFKQKWNWAFFLLGAAVACKTNIALVLPFYAVYLFKSTEVNTVSFVKGLLIFLITVIGFNLPYIQSEGFIQMVYNNEVQQQVFDLYYQFNDHLIVYFIPAVFFMLFLWYLSMRFVNKEQLILFISFTFLSLTMFIAPMQGWYYWIIPFLIYFALKHDRNDRILLLLLSGLYFLYFGVTPESDYFKSFIFNDKPWFTFDFSDRIIDVIFTLLQTTLLIFSFMVFKKGIHNNLQVKFLSKPFLIGIGGDSASGKSTLTNSLVSVFSNGNSSVVRGDDMHKWERGNENWKKFTHLDPKANNLFDEMSDAARLKTGNRIERKFYDHGTGKFTLPEFIKPSKLIVFEGLHPFYLRTQADLYDLKVFMEPVEELRTWWKIKRDVNKRGYTPEKVVEQLKMREKDSLKFIQSQGEYADLKIIYYPTEDLDKKYEIAPNIGLKVELSNEINLEPLISEFSKYDTLSLFHEYSSNSQELRIEGIIDSAFVETIIDYLVPELEDVGIYNSTWKSDFEGVLQALIVYVVFFKIKNNTI